MASDDWPDERARATAVVGSQGLDETGGGRVHNRQIHERSDPGARHKDDGPSRKGVVVPVAAFLQRRTERKPPVAIRWPSGENAIDWIMSTSAAPFPDVASMLGSTNRVSS